MGLGILMISGMVAAILYLFLDDRCFCLRHQRIDLDTSPNPTSNGKDTAKAATSLKKTPEDDQQRLCAQHTEQHASRGLLMGLSGLQAARMRMTKNKSQ